MKSTQNSEPTTFEDVEDLTLFADEAFDTDDVDLFEFTGEDDSQLTRLKSIILSLDWEISDDILQELCDEIQNLQQMWQDDKIAEVYLQGLDKIGRYLRIEGAYSHPNAIKLLLSFYYDFEKIISSHDITGEAITSLLKSDVRKFKILQYQISLTEGRPTPEGIPTREITAEETTTEPEIACEPLKNLKATILGLDWEVTDDGLNQFKDNITSVREHFSDNQSAQILVQGLQALGSYIADVKAQAHPDAFLLLHSFYEGLETLLEDEQLSDEQRQDLLVDRINRLNNLKAIIAGAAVAAGSGRLADEVLEEILEPGEAASFEEDTLIAETTKIPLPGGEARAAMETADTLYPEDVLDPSAIQPVTDKIADDFIEDELSAGTEVIPALSGFDEVAGIEEEPAAESPTAPPADDIEEQLDLLFTEADESDFEQQKTETPGLDEGESLEFTVSDDELVSDFETTAPALADTTDTREIDEGQAVAGRTDSVEEDIEEQMDLLFGEDESEAVTTEPGESAQIIEDEGIAPALADADEEGGFTEAAAVAALDEAPVDELEEKLDSFFSKDEEESAAIAAETEPVVEPEDVEVDSIAPALAGEGDEQGFNEDDAVGGLADTPSDELEEKLDSFFGKEEQPPPAEETDIPMAEVHDEALDDMVAPAPADEPVAEESIDESAAATAPEEEPGREFEEDLDAFLSSDEKEMEPAPPSHLAPETEKAPAETEEKLDLFFSEDEEPESLAAPGQATALAALGSCLSRVAKSPSTKNLTEGSSLISELQKQSGQGTEQTVLLKLLDSILTLPRHRGAVPEDTNDLIDFLYRHIDSKKVAPEILVTSIGRFTEWQKGMIDNIIKTKEIFAPGIEDSPETYQHVAKEVRSEFTSLRSTLKEEFDTLRKELK